MWFGGCFRARPPPKTTADPRPCDCCGARLGAVDFSTQVRHILANWEEGPERQGMLDQLGGHQRCAQCKYVNHVHHCDCFLPFRGQDDRFPRSIAEDVAQHRDKVRHGEACEKGQRERMRRMSMTGPLTPTP